MKNNSFNEPFSTIYVEKQIRKEKRTNEILSKFPNATVIEIQHAKDIFDRTHQSYSAQRNSQNLILSKTKEPKIYQGSPVCQSFDERYFYYTSTVKNCIYDCEYCWLKGLYQSANLLVQVNLEDTFLELEKMLRKHPVYLCVSYDTDLIALEKILGYAKAWADFTLTHENLTIEIRTKSAMDLEELHIPKSERIIIAYTLSPEYVVSHYEKGTPSSKNRIAAIRRSIEEGYSVRICFDPMLWFLGWKEEYKKLLINLLEEITINAIRDISIGSFRLSESYLKKMRGQYPHSAILQYPYQNDQGFYSYGKERKEELEGWMKEELKQFVSEEKIFLWKEEN